jgi:hypothetical protein
MSAKSARLARSAKAMRMRMTWGGRAQTAMAIRRTAFAPSPPCVSSGVAAPLQSPTHGRPSPPPCRPLRRHPLKTGRTEAQALLWCASSCGCPRRAAALWRAASLPARGRRSVRAPGGPTRRPLSPLSPRFAPPPPGLFPFSATGGAVPTTAQPARSPSRSSSAAAQQQPQQQRSNSSSRSSAAAAAAAAQQQQQPQQPQRSSSAAAAAAAAQQQRSSSSRSAAAQQQQQRSSSSQRAAAFKAPAGRRRLQRRGEGARCRSASRGAVSGRALLGRSRSGGAVARAPESSTGRAGFAASATRSRRLAPARRRPASRTRGRCGAVVLRERGVRR